jgi:hypothetical protein
MAERRGKRKTELRGRERGNERGNHREVVRVRERKKYTEGKRVEERE